MYRSLANISQERTSGQFAQLVVAAIKTWKVSKRTLKQYDSACLKLQSYFSDFRIEQIKPLHVKRLKREMIDRPVAFNTTLTVLRQVMEYAVEEELIEFNPCVGTKAYRTQARERLITPAEFMAVWNVASPRLQILMDLWLLTGQRVNAVIGIKIEHVREDGIYFPAFKTKGQRLVSWTPELRAVVERIRSLPRHIKATTLLHGPRGKKLDYGTIREEWQETCQKAGVPYTQMRDLRAMSLTAVEEEQGEQAAQALAGHASPTMTRNYLRNRKVKVVTGPSKK
jgi:integrase